MSNLTVPDPDEISEEQFKACLERYAAYVETISEAKGAKDGQKTLTELDRYRYDEALERFSVTKGKFLEEQEDLITLMEWKLRHGKFRPTLMSLIKSNSPDLVRETTLKALGHFAEDRDANMLEALKTLSTLRGVGPATASLLLAVHDPDKQIFFSDEAYYWLCCTGKHATIKYNVNEYKTLCSRAAKLIKRLAVRAVDIEKVAFILMRKPAIPKTTTKDAKPESKVKASTAGKPAVKRKVENPTDANDVPGPRPPKRGKIASVS